MRCLSSLQRSQWRLCEGNSLVTGEFPTQMASNVENDSIWWCHYDNADHCLLCTRNITIILPQDIFLLCIILWHWNHRWIFQQDRNKQGKSEGFESCDWPVVRKRPIWVKIGDVKYCVTLKFDRWPWKTIGHLSFAVSSFLQHFIAIGELKLELQSGNAQFGSNSTTFRAVWLCNLTYDLEKQ